MKFHSSAQHLYKTGRGNHTKNQRSSEHMCIQELKLCYEP